MLQINLKAMTSVTKRKVFELFNNFKTFTQFPNKSNKSCLFSDDVGALGI